MIFVRRFDIDSYYVSSMLSFHLLLKGTKSFRRAPTGNRRDGRKLNESNGEQA